MARYQIWDKATDIITPSGEKFTAEQWSDRYQWTKIPGVKMVITGGVINGGVAYEFEDMKQMYSKMGVAISDNMSDQDILDAIEYYEDHPPVNNTPTDNERIAAALELLALEGMPDII